MKQAPEKRPIKGARMKSRQPRTSQRKGEDQRSVRNDRYRYTEWGSEKMAELYDHLKDPHEYTNLVNDPKSAQALAEMQKLLKGGWQAALPAARATSKKAAGK